MTLAGHDYRQLRPKKLEKVIKSKKKNKILKEKIKFYGPWEKKYWKHIQGTKYVEKTDRFDENVGKIYIKSVQNGLLELFLLFSTICFGSLGIILWIIAVIFLL